MFFKVSYHIQEPYNHISPLSINVTKLVFELLFMRSEFDTGHLAGALERRSTVPADKKKLGLLMPHLLSKFGLSGETIFDFCMSFVSTAKSFVSASIRFKFCGCKEDDFCLPEAMAFFRGVCAPSA